MGNSDWADDDELADYDERDAQHVDLEWVCRFPGRCLIIGDHMRSLCCPADRTGHGADDGGLFPNVACQTRSLHEQ